jgi:Leucine-rich repeat (LRR) protein
VKAVKVVNYKELAQLQIEEGAKPIADITEEMLWENSKMLQSRLQESDWKGNMETLTFTHLRLASMKGIATLPNLRQLNLSHNLIEKIEAVENCRLLEELNLEENRITKI